MVRATTAGKAVPRLRLGIVGGGQGAFIGAVHLVGARLDDRYELLAGALSSDPTRAKESAPAFRIPPDRAYTSYEEMAEKTFAEIRERAFEKFDMVCMHIYHSLGVVKAGEVCLFVFVSSKHRDVSYEASRYIVEEIKAHVPIFGKELFEDDSYVWKSNN